MDRVSDLMTKEAVHTVPLDATIEAAARRMKRVNKGCLVVVEKKKPVGIITERDLVQRVIAKKLSPAKVRVSKIMSKPLVTVGPEALVSDAATLMAKNKIRRLVVTEGTRLAGILTVTDFARYLQPKTGRDPMLEAMARGALLLPEATPT